MAAIDDFKAAVAKLTASAIAYDAAFQKLAQSASTTLAGQTNALSAQSAQLDAATKALGGVAPAPAVPGGAPVPPPPVGP